MNNMIKWYSKALLLRSLVGMTGLSLNGCDRQPQQADASVTIPAPVEIEQTTQKKIQAVESAYEPSPMQQDEYLVRTPPKGKWETDAWTIEMQRALNTGHDDDVAIQQGGRYCFGVACYEMAGTGVDGQLTQPLYRTGDVLDRLLLVVE